MLEQFQNLLNAFTFYVMISPIKKGGEKMFATGLGTNKVKGFLYVIRAEFSALV